jgi:hypothetical protein
MNVGTLASFIMNYAIYAYPNKEKLKKSLQVIHYKKFCEATDKNEPDYDHNSVNEFFTASDLAIVFWIYENCVRTCNTLTAGVRAIFQYILFPCRWNKNKIRMNRWNIFAKQMPSCKIPNTYSQDHGVNKSSNFH